MWSWTFSYLGQDITLLLQNRLLEFYVEGVKASVRALRSRSKDALATCLQDSDPGVIFVIGQKLLTLGRQGLVEQATITIAQLMHSGAPGIKMAALEAIESLCRQPLRWRLKWQQDLGSALIAVARSECKKETASVADRAIMAYLNIWAQLAPGNGGAFAEHLLALLRLICRHSERLHSGVFQALVKHTQRCVGTMANPERLKALPLLVRILESPAPGHAGWILPLIARILERYNSRTDHIFTKGFLPRFALVLPGLPVSQTEQVVTIARGIFACPATTVGRAIAADIPAMLVLYLGEQVEQQRGTMSHIVESILLHLGMAGRVYLEKNSLLRYGPSLAFQVVEVDSSSVEEEEEDSIEFLERNYPLMVARAESGTADFGLLECELLEFNVERMEDLLVEGACAELEACFADASSREDRIRGLEGVMGCCEADPVIGRRLYRKGVLKAVLSVLGSEEANTDFGLVCASVFALDAILGCAGQNAVAECAYTRRFLPVSMELMKVAQMPEDPSVFPPLLAALCRIMRSDIEDPELPGGALLDGLVVPLGHGSPAASILARQSAGDLAVGDAGLRGRCIHGWVVDFVKAMLAAEKYRQHSLTMFTAMASGGVEMVRLVLGSGLARAVVAELGNSQLCQEELGTILTGLCYMTRAEVADAESIQGLCEMELEAHVLLALKRGQHIETVLCIVHNVLAHTSGPGMHFRSDELQQELERISLERQLAPHALATGQEE